MGQEGLKERSRKMMASISWANYLVVVTLFMSVYYLITVIYFYSSDLQGLLAGKPKRGIQGDTDEVARLQVPDQDASRFSNMEAEVFPSQNTSIQPEIDTSQEIEKLVTHLKEVIGEVKAKKYSKDDFILLLQLVMKEYPAFRDSPFQSGIQELIVAECKKQDSISLTEEDIKDLFKKVA